MSRRLDDEEIVRQLGDLPGWAYIRGALHARYDAPDFPTAVALVQAVATVAEEMNHHPDMDVRWRTVRFELSTHSEGGVTQLDVELAHRIDEEARAVAATVADAPPSVVELAIDAENPMALVPFWRTALGYTDAKDRGDGTLRDPAGVGPTLWFQQMSSPRRERSRTHVDVYLPRALARQRVDDVLAAGGTLVTDEHAPAWWVLADAEGNELCVCSDG